MKGEMYLVKKGNLFGRVVRIAGGICHGNLHADVWEISESGDLDQKEVQVFSRDQVVDAAAYLEEKLGQRGEWSRYKYPGKLRRKCLQVRRNKSSKCCINRVSIATIAAFLLGNGLLVFLKGEPEFGNR